ncbi:N-acetylornithine carbamoyltransferase [Neptunitalea lumnitzerae]|nr:N-acetylornithine carbamoyltransferase [Neptunitalea sp. Y10]
MKEYLDIPDIDNLPELIEEAIALKKAPYAFEALGKHKTIGLLFFNSSLRTRLSTQKAAQQLGMHCIVMNFGADAWAIEFEDGTVMDGSTSEHIKEAAAVISQYCNIVAIRAFPTLTDKEKDLSEHVLNNFKKYGSIPIVNMESATAHPLQALADAITITELKKTAKPKVVLSWAPHPKALPHAVANSFTKIMQRMDVDFVITHPEGYELNPEVTKDTPIVYNQEEAFKDADFIYVKNWSNYKDYGKVVNNDPNWTITNKQMAVTNNAKFMHCLPVRRNVIVADEILDSDASVVIEQANNRTYSAQVVLKRILEHLK